MDLLSQKLGMDPLALRQKNYTETDPVGGASYTSKGLDEAYRRGAEAFGWEARQERRETTDSPKEDARYAEFAYLESSIYFLTK